MKRPLLIFLSIWIMIILAHDALLERPERAHVIDLLGSVMGNRTVSLCGIIEEISGQPSDRKILLGQICFLNEEQAVNDQIPHGSRVLAYLEETNSDRNVTVVDANEEKDADSSEAEVKSQTDVSLECGDLVFLSGKITWSREATNPGQFDQKAYDDARKILFRIYGASVTGSRTGGGIKAFLFRLRERLAQRYQLFLNESDASVMTAMTLGDKSSLDMQLRQLYQDGGIGHILAISGLHVNLLGMMLYQFLRKRRLSFCASGVVSGIILVLYCIMTGASASNIRAVILFLFWAGSQIAGRKSDLAVSLMAAAAVILSMHPGYIREAGFWLSFGCVISIRLFTEPLRSWMPRVLRRIPGLCESMAVSLGTLPLCCWYFYQISPYSFLINLIVIPCLSILMIFLAAASLLSLIIPAGAVFLAAPCHYLLLMFKGLCMLEQRLPGGIFVTGRPRPVCVCGYYAILMMTLFSPVILKTFRKKSGGRLKRRAGRGRKTVFRRIPAAAGILLAVLLVVIRIQPSARICFLDIGQGDCILINSRDGNFLIDCGSSTVQNIWEYRVSPAIRYFGIRTLDGVFLTHGDSDHTNGLIEALSTYALNLAGRGRAGVTISSVWVSAAGIRKDPALEQVCSIAEKKGIPVVRVNKGDHITSGNLIMDCLYPGTEELTEDVNQNSLVLLMKAGKAKILFTGDLEGEGEQRLTAGLKEMDHRQNVNTVCILKVGHHGSRYATTAELLDVLRPDMAVISCGKDNVYGHPAEAVLERLFWAGCKVYRTDQDGCVIISCG